MTYRASHQDQPCCDGFDVTAPFAITVRLASEAKADAKAPAAAAVRTPNAEVTARPIGGPS